MSSGNDNAADEGKVFRLTIRPDGQVYAFGICREVLDLLATLNDRDEALTRLRREAQRADPPVETGE